LRNCFTSPFWFLGNDNWQFAVEKRAAPREEITPESERSPLPHRLSRSKLLIFWVWHRTCSSPAISCNRGELIKRRKMCRTSRIRAGWSFAKLPVANMIQKSCWSWSRPWTTCWNRGNSKRRPIAPSPDRASGPPQFVQRGRLLHKQHSQFDDFPFLPDR